MQDAAPSRRLDQSGRLPKNTGHTTGGVVVVEKIFIHRGQRLYDSRTSKRIGNVLLLASVWSSAGCQLEKMSVVRVLVVETMITLKSYFVVGKVSVENGDSPRILSRLYYDSLKVFCKKLLLLGLSIELRARVRALSCISRRMYSTNFND